MPSLIIFVALLAVLYFLMIRPQRAKQQALQRQLDAIEVGDEILTAGGLFGIVEEFDEEGDLIVQISDGINVRILRRAVSAVVKPEDEDDEEPMEDDEGAEANSDEDVEALQELDDEADVTVDDEPVRIEAGEGTGESRPS